MYKSMRLISARKLVVNSSEEQAKRLLESAAVTTRLSLCYTGRNGHQQRSITSSSYIMSKAVQQKGNSKSPASDGKSSCGDTDSDLRNLGLTDNQKSERKEEQRGRTEQGDEKGKPQKGLSREQKISIGVTAGVAGTGAAMGAVVAVNYMLGAVGFTAVGVAAGSIAAAIQSVVYGGATGGLFSIFQSAGATGVSAGVSAAIAGASGAAGAAGTAAGAAALVNTGTGKTHGGKSGEGSVGGPGGSGGDNPKQSAKSG